MRVDLRSLTGTSGRLSSDEASRVDDPVSGEILVPCRVDLDYREAHATVYLHGQVTGALRAACHRCLDPTEAPIAGEFDVMVRRGENEGETADDVITLALHEHDVVLDPWIDETVVVNAPMILLCREDCRGLCAGCGANLNREPCMCEAPGDPRWEALKKL